MKLIVYLTEIVQAFISSKELWNNKVNNNDEVLKYLSRI